MAVPLQSTFMDWKCIPPTSKSANTVEEVAQRLTNDLTSVKNHQFITSSFRSFPRHSHGNEASPTATEVATYMYPKMHPVAAVIQYERDVVVVGKAWYAQEEEMREKARRMGGRWYMGRIHGGSRQNEEENEAENEGENEEGNEGEYEEENEAQAEQANGQENEEGISVLEI